MRWVVMVKIHTAWVIALACTCFVGGVAAAFLVRVPWCLGVVGLFFVCIGVWVQKVYALPIIMCAGIVTGLGLGSAHLGARSVYEQYIGKTVYVEGRIKEDPTTQSGSTSVQLDAVYINGDGAAGTIYVNVRGSPHVKRGDIIKVTGEARSGFGTFPISISALKLDSTLRPMPGDMGGIVRDWFADKVRLLINEPQASLGIGFLTGQKSALPEDLSEALKIAGLTHIVVASGYNLTILVRLARRLFLKLSKFLSAVSSGLMIILFMAITGLSPSMTRAGLVSGISLMAWYYGHTLHPFVLLPVAAAITVALHPSYVWGDLGWQLSFAAFAGVMLIAPLLQRYFFGTKEPGVLRQIMGETIAAHAITVPIIALSFGTVSHVAIIANILVVPLVPLAMLLTFICGLWSVASLPFGWLVALPANWLLSYMVEVATFVADLPWAQSEVSAEIWLWGIYSALLLVASVWMWRATRLNFRGVNPII